DQSDIQRELLRPPTHRYLPSLRLTHALRADRCRISASIDRAASFRIIWVQFGHLSQNRAGRIRIESRRTGRYAGMGSLTSELGRRLGRGSDAGNIPRQIGKTCPLSQTLAYTCSLL